ncbi:hypothetical protein PanWU01x14_274380, partial [Parasponia andersonii]
MGKKCSARVSCFLLGFYFSWRILAVLIVLVLSWPSQAILGHFLSVFLVSLKSFDMSTPLDRFTSSYLLSGYAFNDYKLKSHKNFSYNSDKISLEPNLGMGTHGDSFATMDAQINLKNPNLGLFVVDTDSHMQRDAAAEFFPSVHSEQKGNKDDSPKTGNHGLGNLNPGIVGLGNAIQPSLVNDGSDCIAPFWQPLSSSVVGLETIATSARLNSGASLMAADKHKNLSTGPSFVQILNSGYNASSVKEDDKDSSNTSFIAPESSKPSIKGSTNAQAWVRFHELPWVYWDRQILSDLARGVEVPIRFDEIILKVNPEVPVKNAFSILKKDLGEEIQNLGEPLMGKKKIWADDVEENLEVEDQAIRRNNDDEILFNAEDQHNKSTMLDVERDLDQGKEQGQSQIL